MLENQFYPDTQNASQIRVATSELTEALASLDARQARREYERVGTLTLAEGIEEFGLDVTPEELAIEVDRQREAEAAKKKMAQRHKRLRFIIRAELVSAALCLLAILGLQHTVFNNQWQQAQQAAEFQQKLRLSTGPHPKYHISVVPSSTPGFQNGQTFGIWREVPAYPLYSVPDGYNIYCLDGLDDDGHNNSFGSLPFLIATTYIEFRKDEVPGFRDNVSVFYNGQRYWRGWIRRQDIPRLQGGHAFTLYPALVASPHYKMADIVPLTVPMQSIQAAHGQAAFDGSNYYQLFMFSEGNHVQLDQHAWEQYSPFSE